MKLTQLTQDELLLTCSWCHRRLREDQESFGAGARVGPEGKGILANNEGKLLTMKLGTGREIIVMVPTAASEARAAGHDVYFQTCSEECCRDLTDALRAELSGGN